MSKVFFIADTHFGHKKIIEYENRPFTSTDEMDRVLIENWNKTVSNDDKIFMLGDFAIPGQEKIKELVSMLNGYKILVMGNHDRIYPYSWWNNESGFDEVSQYPIICNDWFVLSHEPLYMNKNMPYANIYGHVHGNPSFATVSGHSFCVSCERHEYTPVEFNYMFAKIKESSEL